MDQNRHQTRYSRQQIFGPIGSEGQQRLADAHALICGCGALGSLIAERLARAGVGRLTLVDRDWVEWSNLQRQCLFTEEHAKNSIPKSVAAAERLSQINSEIELISRVEDVTCDNIESLAAGCSIILDGTDNFETRFLINDYCVANKIPWVHGGCLGAGGQVLTIVPEETACFQCLMPELPPREAMETCDSAGVLGSAIGVVASWQSGEALKLLSGNTSAASDRLLVIDMWNNDVRYLKLPRNRSCAACGRNEFSFLRGEMRTRTAVLCGKNAVQVTSPAGGSIGEIAERVEKLGTVTQTPYFVRIQLSEHLMTIFPGGRTVVEGTTSEVEAKNIVVRILGS